MQRSIPAVLLTAAAAVPAGAAWAATHTTSQPAAATKATPTPTHKSAKKTTKATTRKFTGPSEDMQWGPVQVTIAVKDKKSPTCRPPRRPSGALGSSSTAGHPDAAPGGAAGAERQHRSRSRGATMTSEAYDAVAAGGAQCCA